MIDLPLLIGNWLLDRNLAFMHHCRTPLTCQIRKHNCTLYLGNDLFVINQGDIATSAVMLEVDHICVLYYEADIKPTKSDIVDIRYPDRLGDIKETKLWVGHPEWDKMLYSIVSGEINGTRLS